MGDPQTFHWVGRYGVRIDQFALPEGVQVVGLLHRAHLNMAYIDFGGFPVVMARKPLKLSEAHIALIL
jgi:hypothetical protein